MFSFSIIPACPSYEKTLILLCFQKYRYLTSSFYPPDLIDRELDKVFDKIKEKNMLKESDKENVFDNLAYVMAELNIIHPFREGNGRSIREFIRLMAKRVGCDLNWGNIDKEKLLEASILSVDNYKVLIGILDTCVD